MESRRRCGENKRVVRADRVGSCLLHYVHIAYPIYSIKLTQIGLQTRTRNKGVGKSEGDHSSPRPLTDSGRVTRFVEVSDWGAVIPARGGTTGPQLSVAVERRGLPGLAHWPPLRAVLVVYSRECML
ncbi:hypothetical protein RRG08_014985 [Elysia crispata]|uniref:Uncharacterized protein n=1 Tax=Elysia crispata TaxID=231223 RepID=A0AAE0ZVZ1_9GAST|nr:hypothetical protein RRG08_014985 [Elysia crispata]